MSQENVETLRAVYARWAQGEFSAGLPLYGPDVVLVVDSDIPDGDTYLGHDGIRRYMLRFLDPWESLTIAAEWFRDAGDTVLVRVRQDGIGRSSGAPAVQRYFQIWTFRGGRVIRLEVILDEGRALKAVGLSK
jgi:ketosteroid isomerase-like protein